MQPANPHLLGQVALQEGLLSTERLEECLRLQKADGATRHLGAILIEKGYLSKEQLEGLIETQRRRLEAILVEPERGGLFGQIALRLGHVTQIHLDEALRDQAALAAEGSPRPLGRILLDKGHLSPDQFTEILARQDKEVVRCPGCDTFYDATGQPEGAKFVCPRCGRVTPVAPRTRSTSRLLGPSPDDIRGETIGRYQILSTLGQGGMGVVYKALHRDLNRVFALKVLKPGDETSAETVKRFQREARMAARLKHPNIVSVHDAGEESGVPFIAMEHIDGELLSDHLDDRRGRPRELLALFEKVARATAHAHDKGVLHRDLKPANIMVDRDGEPHVMDFGLSRPRFAGSLLTRTNEFLGTPSYMSPEMIRGTPEIDARSDVYSLGVILYEILCGRIPFPGANSAAVFHNVINLEPVQPRRFNKRVPLDLQTICLKALEKDLARRYPSAQALADDVRRHLEGEPILARPLGPAARLARRIQGNPAATVALTATLLLVVTGGILIGTSIRNTRAFERRVEEARQDLQDGRPGIARDKLLQALTLRPEDAAARNLLEETDRRLRAGD